MTDITLKTGKIINLAHASSSIKYSDVAESSVSIFNKLDANSDNILTQEEISAGNIAENLNSDISGWGTSSSFGKNFTKINGSNVVSALKIYKSSYNNSLLHDIAREWESLPVETRKKCIEHIRNLVFNEAKKQNLGIDLKTLSQDFDKELQRQVDSVTVMNTKNLDEILNYVMAVMESKHSSAAKISGKELAEKLSKIESENDVISLCGLINEDNIREISGFFDDNYSVIQSLYNNKNISVRIRNVLLDKIMNSMDKNDPNRTCFAAQSMFYELNNGSNKNITKLFANLSSENIQNTMLVYEKTAEVNKMNNTNLNERRQKFRRKVASWPQTMMQAIINTKSLNNAKKKEMLNRIVDIAAERAKSTSLSQEKQQKYINEAKKRIANLDIDDNTNVDKLTILVDELIGSEDKIFTEDMRKETFKNYGGL